MKPKREWRDWLEAQIARFQTARRLAEALGLDEAAITRWRRYGFLPQSTDVERLATVTGTPVLELLVMLWTADRERLAARARPPTGATGSPGAPSAKPAPPNGHSRRRRGKLAVILGLGLMGATTGSAYAADNARVMAQGTSQGTHAKCASELRYSVAIRRRRAA